MALDSDVLGESRSRKLVMDGDEGVAPEAAKVSKPRSPCPTPADKRLEASRKEALRGGAEGPPSPTGRRSCNGGSPDLRLRLEERAAAALFRARRLASYAVAELDSNSRSASSSCSTLKACLSAERWEASEREVGRRACVMVDVEAMLCCEMEAGGDEVGGEGIELDSTGACADKEARATADAGGGDGMLRGARSEAGLSVAEV